MLGLGLASKIAQAAKLGFRHFWIKFSQKVHCEMIQSHHFEIWRRDHIIALPSRESIPKIKRKAKFPVLWKCNKTKKTIINFIIRRWTVWKMKSYKTQFLKQLLFTLLTQTRVLFQHFITYHKPVVFAKMLKIVQHLCKKHIFKQLLFLCSLQTQFRLLDCVANSGSFTAF